MTGKKKKEIRSELLPFARQLKDWIEQAGESANSFSQKYGINTATIYQWLRGTDKITYPSAVNLAKALRKAINLKITADQIMSLVEFDDGPAEKRRSPEILPPSTLLWHLRQFTPEAHRQFWREALRIAADAYEPGESSIEPGLQFPFDPRITQLCEQINFLCRQHSLNSVEELAEWMLIDKPDPNGTSKALMVSGLNEILVNRRIPLDPAIYGALMGSLARVLGFESDLMLISFCGLKASDAPVDLSQESGSKTKSKR